MGYPVANVIVSTTFSRNLFGMSTLNRWNTRVYLALYTGVSSFVL